MREPDSLQTYTHLLQRAGWEPTSFRLRKILEFKTDRDEKPIQARLLTVSHESRPVLTLVVLDGARLPSAMTLYQRYLDMTIEGRLALRAAALLAPAPYLLLASPYESFLYHCESEELLLHATSPEEAAARIFTPLRVEQFLNGSLEAIPRRNAQQWGKDLADWLRVWGAKLGRTARLAPDVMRALLAHWVLAWRDSFASLPDRAPDSLGVIVEAASEPAMGIVRPPSPTDFFNNHLRFISDRFPFGMFAAYGPREEMFWNEEAIAPLLVSFLSEARLLSRSKFSSNNVLYAYTNEDTEKKSWRLALTEKVRIGERMHRSDLIVFDPIVANVDDEGYGWSLVLLQDLVGYWIQENFKRKQQAEQFGSLSVQMDFLQPSLLGVNPRGYLDNVLLFVTAHCFRARTNSADERSILSLLLALKLYELAEWYKLPLGRFEGIENVFEA